MRRGSAWTRLLFDDVALTGAIGSAGREVGLEGASRLLNRRHQAVGVPALLEVARQEGDEFIPPGLAHFFVKSGAAHDGESLRFGREENQQAVFVRGGFEAQFLELMFCGGEGIFRFAMADEENDGAGGPFLGGPNCLMDAVVLQSAQKVFQFHGQKAVARARYQPPPAPPPEKLPPPPVKPPPPPPLPPNPPPLP